MGIALFNGGRLTAPLRTLLSWLVREPGAPRCGAHATAAARPCAAVKAPICSRPAQLAAAGDGPRRGRRPLRVVRVVEPPRSPAGAGRMFISGRMADVCAELDRLAAIEAAAH